MARPSEDDARARFDEACAQASEAAETAAAIAPWPAELTMLLLDPPSRKDLSPPRVDPHDEKMVLGYVGSRPSELLVEAFRIVGHKCLWLALLHLEPPTSPPDPKASLAQWIDRGRVTVETLEHLGSIFMRPAMVDEVCARVRIGETIAEVPLAHVLVAASEFASNAVRSWEAALSSRIRSAEQTQQATISDRGARGPLSGNARVRQFYELAARHLLAAKWSRRRVAELVLGCADWEKSPCREYVRALLSGTDDDRGRAISRFASRLRDAERRDS